MKNNFSHFAPLLENKYQLKTIDGVFIEVGMTVYICGQKFTIESFGNGMANGQIYVKEKNSCIYGFECYVDKQLSIIVALEKKVNHRISLISQELIILKKSMEELLSRLKTD